MLYQIIRIKGTGLQVKNAVICYKNLLKEQWVNNLCESTTKAACGS